MDDVGLATGALLALMLLETELPGLADDFQVVAGAVGVDGGEEGFEVLIYNSNFGRSASGEAIGGAVGPGENGGWRKEGANGFGEDGGA